MSAPAGSDRIVERISPFRRLLNLAQTGFATAGLCGVAYWGHETDWTFAPRPNATPRDVYPAAPVVTTGADGTTIITFNSSEAAEVAGIESAPVWKTAMAETVAADGEITFDPNRVIRVSARAGGVCVRVLKRVGDPVRTGDVLAVIDAADVGRVKADLLQRVVQLRMKRRIHKKLVAAGDGVSTRQRADAEAEAREAELKCRAAEQQLASLGFSIKTDDLIGLPTDEAAAKLRYSGIQEAATSTNLLPVRSPGEGVLLEARITHGEHTETGRDLFLVVDPERVRLTLRIPETHARRIAVGQSLTFRQDGSTQESEGVIDWLATAVEPSTRTLPAGAELDNAGGRFIANALGRGRIVVRNAPNALTVPSAAVQPLNGQTVVFVRDRDYLKDGGPKSFRLRSVRVGTADTANTEILAGLADGEVVAGRGSAFLLHETQRTRTENFGGTP